MAKLLKQQLTSILSESFGLRAVIGAELECYVALAEEGFEGFWKPIHDWVQQENIPFKRIEKERGDTQFEIVLGTAEASEMAAHLLALKKRISEEASKQGCAIHYISTPKVGEPSSGLHLHVHLENEEGQNVFYKTPDEISEAFGQSLAGMLGTMPLAMDIWCPEDVDHKRFDDIDHVPRTMSWGMNNRYAALRIPATINPFKVIEHRMSSANANPEQAIAAMLAGIIVGLEFELPTPEQEFGKPTARAPKEWVSFLQPDAQQRFLRLIGKGADELGDVANVTAISE